MDMNIINQLSAPATGLNGKTFIELYNSLNGTTFKNLDELGADMKQKALVAYISTLTVAAPTAERTGPSHVSKWDRNTVEGRANNADASRRSREKKKAEDEKKRQDAQNNDGPAQA